MTRIPPFPPSPATGLRSSVPHADEHMSSNPSSFASLLAQAPATDGIDLLGPTSAPGEDATIRQAVAEVFNAHGFFARGPGDAGATSKPPPYADHATPNRQLVPSATQPNVGDRDLPVEFDRSDQLRFGARPPLSTEDVDAGRPQSRAVPRGRVSALQITDGRPMSAGSALARTEGDVSEPLNEIRKPLRSADASSTADRLIFQIGSHVVQLTGRIQALSKDEQDQLVARLNALLESHGLSLGEATLNGRSLTSAILRSNH